MQNRKEVLRLKRHCRIKLKMYGTQEKPRLIVQRSLNNLSACVIDDAKNKTLFSLSTQNNQIKQKLPQSAGNIKAASIFGEIFAKEAKEKGISKIIFDRAGFLYHGRIKAFAEALRKGGLDF